jgi:hypothetical protein
LMMVACQKRGRKEQVDSAGSSSLGLLSSPDGSHELALPFPACSALWLACDINRGRQSRALRCIGRAMCHRSEQCCKWIGLQHCCTENGGCAFPLRACRGRFLAKSAIALHRRWIRRARRENVSRPSVINPEQAAHLHPPRDQAGALGSRPQKLRSARPARSRQDVRASHRHVRARRQVSAHDLAVRKIARTHQCAATLYVGKVGERRKRGGVRVKSIQGKTKLSARSSCSIWFD